MLDNLFLKNAEDNCVLQRLKERQDVRFRMSFKSFLSRKFTNFFYITRFVHIHFVM